MRFLKISAVLVGVFAATVLGLYLWWSHADRVRLARLQVCIDQEVPAWRERLATGEVKLAEPVYYIDAVDSQESAIFHYLHGGEPVAHRALQIRTSAVLDAAGKPTCEAKEMLVED